MASFHPLPPGAGVTPDTIWPSYPPISTDVIVKPEIAGRFPPFSTSDFESARKYDLRGVRADEWGRVPRVASKRLDGSINKCPITVGWNTISEPERRKIQLSYTSTSFAMYGDGLKTGKRDTNAWVDPLGRKHERYSYQHLYIPVDTFYSADRMRYDEAGRLQSYGFMPFPYTDWNPWISEKYRSTVPVPSPSLYAKSKKYDPKSA